MICEKCGREYEGDHCPYCSHGPEMPDLSGGQQEKSSPERGTFDNADHPGVHSDTLRPPQWTQQEPQQPGQPPRWNRPGTGAPGASGQNGEVRCPICGYPVTGNFCQRCGTPNPKASAQGPSQPSYQQPGPYQSQPYERPYQTQNFYQPYSMGQPGKNRFRENYQAMHQAGRFSKKPRTGIVLLMLLGILMKLISLGTVWLTATDENLIDDFYREYYYREYYYSYDFGDDYDYYYDYDDDGGDNWVDSGTDDGFKSYVREDAADTGESLIPNGVSIEEFRQLQPGMTYGAISYIIGGDAVGQDTSAEEGQMILVWTGEYQQDAVVRVTFDENGEALSIEQNGLDADS